MVLPDAGRHQKDIVAVQQKLKIALQEPAAGSKDKGNTQHDESQPEMELIETVMSAKDPITKRDIQDPVKNTVGGGRVWWEGHTYLIVLFNK